MTTRIRAYCASPPEFLQSKDQNSKEVGFIGMGSDPSSSAKKSEEQG